MSKSLPALVDRLLNATGPVTFTSDEAKWLAEEFARLHAQRTEAEGDIQLPEDREALRKAVESEEP
jgi:hypothetical protein